MNKKLIAKRLKELRENAKLSQQKLAEVLEVKQPLIAKYENGIILPSIGILVKYSDQFDVSLDYLVGRVNIPQGGIPKSKIDYFTDNMNIKLFVEMCLDSTTDANAKLKETLLKLVDD